jgi:drug/metabolite transporter (DMT)-like permease
MYLEFIISIIGTSFLLNIFKYFHKFKVVTLNAIIINYIIAASLSFIVQGESISYTKAVSEPWIGIAFALGVLFILLFNLMAYCSNKLGVASTSIANKITFIFPTFLWIIFYNESISVIKFLGLFIALFAIFLTGEKSKTTSFKGNILLLIALFIGGGVLDTLLSYAQQELVPPEQTSIFFGYLFFFAFVVGIILMAYKKTKGHPWPTKKDVIWGVILGVPNYFAMFLFLKSLEKIPNSTAFPVANMGVILGSTLLSVLLFKEHLSRRKYIALFCAMIAILLISFHQQIGNLIYG